MRSLGDTLGLLRFGGTYYRRTIQFFMLFALCFFCSPAQAQYGGGSGTENDPYQIRTAEQMNTIGATRGDWGKHFQLRADIDLSEYTDAAYNIIGTEAMNESFTGVFDGNDHTISNFSMNSARQKYTGLFGYVTGQVINLGLINPDVFSQGSHVGGLAGYLDSGTITSCYVKGANVSGDDYIGGLVGSCTGIVYKSYSTGSVIGDVYIGGLIGIVDNSTINTSYSKASVSGQRNVGGFAGKTIDETSVISNCYATGNVNGGTYSGGLVGQIERGRTFNSYSTGSVSGDQYVGGFTGFIRVQGSAIHCFWDTQTSGWSTSPGGTGRTTIEMQTITTFINAGWDFNAIWTICDGMNYPVLLWQIPAADFLCPDGVDFIDFAFFAQHWLDDRCNAANFYCEGTDFDNSGYVGFTDLEIFTDNWLNGIP
ncbi:GLUG motif-containing protein [Planctomycetota bacterium]